MIEALNIIIARNFRDILRCSLNIGPSNRELLKG